jgi:hypothetical protein
MTILHENAESGGASAGQLTPDAGGAIDFLERWTDGAAAVVLWALIKRLADDGRQGDRAELDRSM